MILGLQRAVVAARMKHGFRGRRRGRGFGRQRALAARRGPPAILVFRQFAQFHDRYRFTSTEEDSELRSGGEVRRGE
jgi:hypothetical protein